MKANHIAFSIDYDRNKSVFTNSHFSFEDFATMRCCSFGLN